MISEIIYQFQIILDEGYHIAEFTAKIPNIAVLMCFVDLTKAFNRNQLPDSKLTNANKRSKHKHKNKKNIKVESKLTEELKTLLGIRQSDSLIKKLPSHQQGNTNIKWWFN